MIVYPDFRKIIIESKKLMKRKYPLYGNSWMNFSPKSWWKNRLQREVNEIFKAKNPEDAKKEICDTINVLAMMWENAEGFRYGKKGNKTK